MYNVNVYISKILSVSLQILSKIPTSCMIQVKKKITKEFTVIFPHK